MGCIADDHYAELSWSGDLWIDDDGYPTVPPFAPQPGYGYGPIAGGMDLWISQATERGICAAPPPPPPPLIVNHNFDRLTIHGLLDAKTNGKLRPCPRCGSAAKVIEYPLGIACSRWACAPGRSPIYLSDEIAVANGFDSVISFWNDAVLTPDRDALIWQSLLPGVASTPHGDSHE